jgi:hypothetical protein
MTMMRMGTGDGWLRLPASWLVGVLQGIRWTSMTRRMVVVPALVAAEVAAEVGEEVGVALCLLPDVERLRKVCLQAIASASLQPWTVCCPWHDCRYGTAS